MPKIDPHTVIPRLLDRAGAEAYLGLGRHSFAKLVKSGAIPRIRIELKLGSRPVHKFDRQDLDRWIDSRRTTQLAPRPFAPRALSPK